MKHIPILLLLLASGVALAGAGLQEKLGELEAELKSVRQEQQSVYQNYQMTKEMRRMEVQEGQPPMAQQPYGTDIDTPWPNYDDVQRKRMERERRIQQYTSDLKNLSVRYLELEERRKALLKQIGELKRRQGD